MSSTTNQQSPPSPQNPAAQTGQNTNQTNITNSNPPAWPTNLPLTEKIINDANWPTSLKLDVDNSNWDEWSHRMQLVAERQGFDFWLEGTFAQPDVSVDEAKHYIWAANDKSLRAFMLSMTSRNECKSVRHLKTAKEIWETLRARHEKKGPFSQIMLVKQGMDTRFAMAKPVNETINEIDDLCTRIDNMGEFNIKTFRNSLLINALSGEFEYLQSSIYGMGGDPGFSFDSIVHRIQREGDLIRHRGINADGPSALLAQNGRRERTICSHCQKPGHSAEYCIAPGGKFVGHSLEEARAAQRAA